MLMLFLRAIELSYVYENIRNALYVNTRTISSTFSTNQKNPVPITPNNVVIIYLYLYLN